MIKINFVFFILLSLIPLSADEQSTEEQKKTTESLENVFNGSYVNKTAFSKWFSETKTYGDLYLAESLYHDWKTESDCSALEGKICASFNCPGSHYINEFCCCDTKYNKPKPRIDSNELIAAGQQEES